MTSHYSNLGNLPLLVFTLDPNFKIDAARNILSEMGSTRLQILYICIFGQVVWNTSDIKFRFAKLDQLAVARFELLV